MQFHERLFELRRRSGMTQNDLAERLDVSRQAVSRWEMGTAKPDIDNLVALSELYGVTLDYLIKGVERETPEQAVQMQDKPEAKAQKSNMEAGCLFVLFVILWVVILLRSFNPIGALVTAGVLTLIAWGLIPLIRFIIRTYRE